MVNNIQEEVEDKVIDCITLGSGGRLVIFKPEKSDKDLVVEWRGDYKKRTIEINVYNGAPASAGKISPKGNFYLMFVNFDIVKQDIGDEFIFMPSASFSQAIKSNNFSKFLTTKQGFVNFLIEALSKK